ncbi:unnamed protein product [Closterium sp. NIES-65]|nr:unnamed protein product [Closterium sp. NIES-65]
MMQTAFLVCSSFLDPPVTLRFSSCPAFLMLLLPSLVARPATSRRTSPAISVASCSTLPVRPRRKRKPVAHAGSRSVVAADGYFWHKYGQKSVMDRAITRAYFRCARHSMGCMARKTVDVPIATTPAATASAPSLSAAAASLATADGSVAKPSDTAPPSSAAALQPQVSYHGTHNHTPPGPCSLSLPNCAAAAASAAAAEGDIQVPVSASPGADGADGAATVVPVSRTDHQRRPAVAESADVAVGSGTGAADAASAVAPLGLTHRLSLNSTVSLDRVPLSPASAAAHPALALTLATPTTAHNLPAAAPGDAQRPSTAEAAAAAAAAEAGDSGSCTDEPMAEQSKQSPAGTRGSMEVGSVRAEDEDRLACSTRPARSHSVEAQPEGNGDAAQRGGNGVGHHGEERGLAGALRPHPSAAAAAAVAGSHPSISAAFAAAASAAASGPAFALPSAGPGNLWAMAPPPGTSVPGAIPPGATTTSSSFQGPPLPALPMPMPMPMQTHPATATHLASMAHAWGHHSHPSLPSAAAAVPLSPLGHHLPSGMVVIPSIHPPPPLFNPLHHSHVPAASGSAFAYPTPHIQAAQAQAQMQVQAQLQLRSQLQAQQQAPPIHSFQAQPPGSADPVANSHTLLNFRSADYPQLSTSKPLLHHAPSELRESTGHHGGSDVDESARHLASSGREWNSIMEGSHQEAKRICVEWGQTKTGRPEDKSSPLSFPPAQPPLPLASLAESPVGGASQPLSLVRPEPATPMFPFGPFQPLRCSRGEGVASREPLAETPSPGGGGEACAERGGASVNPLESGLPSSQLQLVLVAGDTTALPPPAEEPSAWPWTWQERLRAVKRRRMDARECEEAAQGEARGSGGAQDWGKLEAEAEEERRRKQRLGILSGMRQMLDSPGFAAARGQRKRKLVVRQGGLRHRLPTMRGASSASGSGDQSSENTNFEERATEAAREAENARAANDVATLAEDDAAQLTVGGRVGAAGGVDTAAAAPVHARELGSSVATVRRGGSSSGRNGRRNGGGGRCGEYEVESTQCAAEKAEEGTGLAEKAEEGPNLAERGEAAHPPASPCSDAEEAERAGEKRKAHEAQNAADGAAGRAHVRRRHGLPSRLGNLAAPPTAAAPLAPPAQAHHGNAPPSSALPSAPCTALPFPLLSPDTPHRSRPSYPSRLPLPSPLPFRTTPALAEPQQVRQTGHPSAAEAVAPEAAALDSASAAIAASVDFPLWVRQLQACAGVGEEGRASECTGETPGSMLDVPQVQPAMEGSDASGGSGGSGSSGEGCGGEEEDHEAESRGGQ